MFATSAHALIPSVLIFLILFIHSVKYDWSDECLESKRHPLVTYNRPYSRRGHDGQKERLGWQIYRKFARQYVNHDVTSLLLHVPVT